MSEEPTNFKVTDRRLFNPDGTPRDIAPEEEAKPQPQVETAKDSPKVEAKVEATVEDRATQASSTLTEQPAPEPRTESEVDEEELAGLDDPAGFVNFVMSIASNAASSMGMMEHPVTHSREVNLDVAKHWIDVLGMLEQKTRNNLLAQEERILEGLLADLRMQYVSLTSSATASASSPLTGRDIVGG